MFIKSFCVTRQKSANEFVTERVCDRDNVTDIYLDEWRDFMSYVTCILYHYICYGLLGYNRDRDNVTEKMSEMSGCINEKNLLYTESPVDRTIIYVTV